MTKVKNLEEMMVNFYKTNISKGKAFVAHHFMDCGISKATAYRKIAKLEAGSLNRKVGSGRKAKIATNKNIQKIGRLFENKSGCSQRNVARKFKCDQSYISKILHSKTGIRTYKKTRKPNRNEQQKKDIRPKCRKLYNQYHHLDVLMDDESYFTLSNSALAGNDRYYASDRSACAKDVRYKLVQKFEKKLLVSVCISPKGISPLYIKQNEQAVNQFSYIAILQKTLIPLISKYYKTNNHFIFWPDLATAHYAKSVLEFLRTKNINVVPKELNPANLPEARPIENFWGDLKRLVYADNWIAKDLANLEKKIRKSYSKMNNDIYLSQIRHVHKKLKSIARKGL